MNTIIEIFRSIYNTLDYLYHRADTKLYSRRGYHVINCNDCSIDIEGPKCKEYYKFKWYE